MREDKMVGWHYQFSGNTFEEGLGDGEGRGSLTFCSPWGRKELVTTKRLNNKTNPYFPPLNAYRIWRI